MRLNWHVARLALVFAMLAVLVHPAPAAAGSYSRLQILMPGETAAPGTSSGKTGTPRAQTAGVSFTVTVRACDSGWNTVTTVTDAVAILTSDASATLPAPAQLASGTRTFSVTFNAGGNFTVFAHDQTDGTIPDAASGSVASLVIQGFEFSRITQKNQNAGQPMTTTVVARDPSGNQVSGYNGDVQLKEITSFGDGRTSPDHVTLTGGSWTGPVTMYRADETSINRGNVNLYAWLAAAPSKNGTSDPFTVHPGGFARVQLLVPGQSPLPGSVSGVTGTPSAQAASRNFSVQVYSTDSWWNPVYSGDAVRITSGDAAASTPVSGGLSSGVAAFSLHLGTVGAQTLTVNDQSNGGITGMTSAPISVIPSSVDHFAISTIGSPVTAGVPVAVTIRAADASGNTVPGFAEDIVIVPNTGAGSVVPGLVTLSGGTWSGTLEFRGAGGAVSFSVSDFTSPPDVGTSNSFTVQPGPLHGVQVLVPGESPQGGTASGRSGTPSGQSAGAPFTLTLRAVDRFWNLVPGVSHHVALGSSDAFAGIPADTMLANGQLLVPARLYRTGGQRIWVSDSDDSSILPDTSSAVNVTGGPFAKLLVLAPGESPAPGTASGRTGAATDQSINYAFNVTVMATDSWWNPVGGVSDLVHITSDDPGATLPADQALVNGTIDLPMRLARGGYDQITVADASQPSKTGSSTQVRAISSGFHLEASVTPNTARAGDPFTLTVKVTNDAGSVIQEINSFVTIEVRNAGTSQPGRGTLLTRQFQLLQGQRSIAETYTFAEPIVLEAHDDAGNAPAVSAAITITPGAPASLRLTSDPAWVGGNKHARVVARVLDAFENGVPGSAVTFALLSGLGTLTPVDSATSATGEAAADFLSPRQPEKDRLRATSGSLTADLDLETSFVDPNAAGGTVTNYPNPFHPPAEGTTVAYKLADDASVRLRIFDQTGGLVREMNFTRSGTGGRVGLNEVVWDGRNGRGDAVASGGYILFVEAQGVGQTLHVMRRKIAVVR